MEVLEMFEELLEIIADIAILLFEFIGVGVAIYVGIKGFVMYVKHMPKTKLILAEGLATALEFLMVGEILKTVTAQEWTGIAVLACIIVFRVSLTILIHWEIRQEELAEERLEKKAENKS